MTKEDESPKLPEPKPNPWVDDSIRTTEKLEQKSVKEANGKIKKNI